MGVGRFFPRGDHQGNYPQVGEGGVQSTLLCIHTLLLYFKFKQAQNLRHNKAILLYTISCRNMKTTLFRKNFTINLKRILFLSNVPHAWGTLDMSVGYTSPVNKKLGCMHWIMFT